MPAGICDHVTPSRDVATFAPLTASYPTAAHIDPFQNASLHTPPRNAELLRLTRLLPPHDRPPSVDIAVAPVDDGPNKMAGC